ncbi:hypothetical protein Vretimale_18189 [Volvox reticuliferus]|uniref:Sulfotransferase n=1 Tax=Volvox reticuliferus TaxID=1737510 RepID=A0A8J4CUW7_9CHLO|nr:hypothetical protein Vretifemale_17962 [Volvox reticuliferus]GIM15413.1 hypothetical protein Vretimale_18189 [Volvox reticuliferus]
MKRVRNNWPSVLLFCLGLLSLTVASNIIQDVFMELFGEAAKDEEARTSLLAHLDTLLALGISRPGEKLVHIPEYADPQARQLGINISQSLASSGLDEWANRVLDVVPKLDETKSFAMVRRLLVAALLKYWLKHGNKIPDESASKIQDVLLQLYNVHRIGAVNKGIMEYLHVSKSGGTSWCHIAELNGCTTERYDKSYVCQIKKFDDKVRWLNMTFHMLQVPVYRVPQYVLKRFSRFGTFRKNHDMSSCSARRKLITNRGYNYYSNEYTVHGGHKGMDNAHMCGNFFNVIVLRDPMKRLVSHMKFVMWTMSGDRGYNDTLLFNRMYANRSSEFWQALGPAIVDNYFIRSLLGEKAFHVPVGTVGREMLSLAEHVLAQFDLVLVLEQDMAIKNLITSYGVGWNHTLEEVHDKDSNIRETEFNTTAYIPEDLNRLLQAQALDMELYEFSKTLAQLDPVIYAVARKAGVQPLPPEASTDKQDPPCGLLRGQYKEDLLTSLGAKKPTVATKGKKDRGAGAGRLDPARQSQRIRTLRRRGDENRLQGGEG